MMTTYYLRLALIPLLLLTAVLLVIRSQPYDDRELREILLPTDCPAPCFMGIRPGVTTMEEAVKLLEASGWVEAIDKQNFPYEVKWKSNLPDQNRINSERQNRVSFSNGIVSRIDLVINFKVGDIRLGFGRPDIEDVAHISMGAFYYRGVYIDKGIFVEAINFCPQSEIEIWNVNLSVTYVQMHSKNFGVDNKIPWGQAIWECKNLNRLAGR